MSKKNKTDFLAGRKVDAALHELVHAVQNELNKQGKKAGLKSFAVVALTSDSSVGVVHSGCDCAACTVAMMESLAEARGMKAEIEAKPFQIPALGAVH